MQKVIKFLTTLIFLFVIVVFYFSLNKDPSYQTNSLVGKKLEELNLESFDGDHNLSTKDFKKNNFTLINFWASWCSPCRVEHPILMSLSKSKKLKLVGINFKDKKNNAKKFLKELGNPYNLIAKDEIGKKSVNFGIYGIPESILVNEEMRIIKKFIGPLNAQDYNEILKIIN